MGLCWRPVIVLAVAAIFNSWCITSAAAQRLDLYEGDVCKEEQGVQWTCKPLLNCDNAKEGLRKGKRPQICSFVGTGTESIVCCEPNAPAQLTVSRMKSKEMCEKYADSVFARQPKPFGDGYTKHDTCAAVMKPLITNGENAGPREYPHMALIGYGPKHNIKWLCGGSLISERFVLSAAHCKYIIKKGPARWVRLGEYNTETTTDDIMGQARVTEFEIIERVVHPNYSNYRFYNDIALFKLNASVQFTEYIRPICLHIEHQLPKTYATATGWGTIKYQGLGSDVLQKVNLTITPWKECSDAYPAGVWKQLRNGILDQSMLCAGDIANGKDTCQGDSGGPLQVRLVEPYCMYSQVGITSFGFQCAKKPGVYTRVSHFVPWIEEIVWPN